MGGVGVGVLCKRSIQQDLQELLLQFIFLTNMLCFYVVHLNFLLGQSCLSFGTF